MRLNRRSLLFLLGGCDGMKKRAEGLGGAGKGGGEGLHRRAAEGR